MAVPKREFILPKTIERFLAALSKLYAHDGKRRLQEILVNAEPQVVAETGFDNWNGGTYGHTLHLRIPETLFFSCVRDKDNIQSEIRKDLNDLHNVENEFIDEVFLQMEESVDHNWRKDSGLLITGKRTVSPDATKRIWGDEGFRVFLSHKCEVKKEAAALKDQLIGFGISSFVAHEDIHPTKVWPDEIENALASMDAFVALMTEKFHDSEWTDQEVGFAFARGVPIIAVRLGKDPYGLIGKFQALSSTWQTAAKDIVKLLIKHDRMFNAYVGALRRCPKWEIGNTLAEVLPGIETLTVEQIDELVKAYNETDELHGSWGFNGTKSFYHGPGLVSHLNRLGSRRFTFSIDGLIETVP